MFAAQWQQDVEQKRNSHKQFMPKEIFPSSYLCDCGHRSHFFDDPSPQGAHHPRGPSKESQKAGSEPTQRPPFVLE